MPSELYQRVARSLNITRDLGLAFPSVFMGISGAPIGNNEVEMHWRDEVVFRGADGELNLCALCGLVDTLLGTQADMHIGPRMRPATAHINLELTGASTQGDISVTARFQGYAHTSRVRQALVGADFHCGDRLIGHASSTCVLMDLPEGRTRATWPWPAVGYVVPQRKVSEFEAKELQSLKACEAAEAAASAEHPFIDHFWCGIPTVGDGEAKLQVAVAPHLGNRAGQVQGGLLLGMAASVAHAAAPGATRVSNISAYFVSASVGPVLDVQAQVVRAGCSLSVVRTQIMGPENKLVLDAMSQHVAL